MLNYTAAKIAKTAKLRLVSVGGRRNRRFSKKALDSLMELYAIEREIAEVESRIKKNWEGENMIPSAKAEVRAGYNCPNEQLKISPHGWMDLLFRAENRIRIWRKQLADAKPVGKELENYRLVVCQGVDEFEAWLAPIAAESRAAFDARVKISE